MCLFLIWNYAKCAVVNARGIEGAPQGVGTFVPMKRTAEPRKARRHKVPARPLLLCLYAEQFYAFAFELFFYGFYHGFYGFYLLVAYIAD